MIARREMDFENFSVTESSLELLLRVPEAVSVVADFPQPMVADYKNLETVDLNSNLLADSAPPLPPPPLVDESSNEKENELDDLKNLNPCDLISGDWPHELDDYLQKGDFDIEDFLKFESHSAGKKCKVSKKKEYKKGRRRPGQVRITTTADGATVFCCPECSMAYTDKFCLERHLVVHKVDRRFICEFCGVTMKRKEHIQRHKLGHKDERPFTCSVCFKGFKRKEHHDIHFVIHSGEKSIICPQCGKGFYRRDHLTTHLKSHDRRKLRKQRREERLRLKRAQNKAKKKAAPPPPPPPPAPCNFSPLVHGSSKEFFIQINPMDQIPIQISITAEMDQQHSAMLPSFAKAFTSEV